MYSVSVIIIGILMSESIVLTDTKLTESEVSHPNLAENIVFIAATGAQQQIIEETSKVSLIPQTYIIASAISGKTNSRDKTAIIEFIFFKPSIILLFARWYPIIIIGTGVLSAAI